MAGTPKVLTSGLVPTRDPKELPEMSTRQGCTACVGFKAPVRLAQSLLQVADCRLQIAGARPNTPHRNFLTSVTNGVTMG